MQALRGEIGRTLRLLIAALMLLAALGAARAQGEAASRQVFNASLGLSLCSGGHALPDGTTSDETCLAHCLFGNLPLAADVPAANGVLVGQTGHAACFSPILLRPAPARPDAAYDSRGPPVRG